MPNAIPATHENGAFRPITAVDLTEATEALVPPQSLAPQLTPEGRARVLAAMAQRFDSGQTDLAARHDEHQP